MGLAAVLKWRSRTQGRRTRPWPGRSVLPLRFEQLENRILLAGGVSVNNVTVPDALLGQTISGTLTPGIETAAYHFTGTAGQRLKFSWLSNTAGNPAYATWNVNVPTIALVGGFNYYSGLYAGQNFAITLPADGSYDLLLTNSQDTALPYQFKVEDISDTPVAVSGLSVQSGSLAASGTNSFTFTGPAGRALFLDSLQPYSYYYYYYYNPVTYTITAPDNTTANSGGLQTAGQPFVLPQSGTYTFTVTNSTSTSQTYDYQLLDLNDPGVTALTLGTPVTNSSLAANAATVYSFTGSAGQQLYYANVANSGSTSWSLMTADGTSAVTSGNANTTSGPFTLPENGTYYLIQTNTASTAVSYSFNLLDVAAQTTVALNQTVTGNLSAGPSAALYRFQGQANERIYLTWQGSYDYYASFQLDGPNGGYVTSGNPGGSPSDVTLPTTGTYTLALIGTTYSSAYAYSFALTTPPVNTTALALGTEVDASLTTPGQLDTYTFAGTAGQRIYVNGLPGTASVSASLIGPSAATAQGTPSSSATFNLNSDSGPYTLTETGTYALRTTAVPSTGTYSFRVLDVASQPTLSVGTSVTGTLDPGTDAALYSFSGTAGQRLFVTWQSASTNNGTYEVIGPDNSVVGYYLRL